MRLYSVGGLCLLWMSLAACDDNDPNAHDEPADSGMDARTRDAAMDSGMDARVDAGPAETWIASKITLDVWWQGKATHDPGRDAIDIYTLSRSSETCDDASEATIRICGITLPTYTSDSHCEAYQLMIPNAAWENPNMPRFVSRTRNDQDAGEQAAKVVTALLGIDLTGGNEDGPWPNTSLDSTLTCEAGTGAACFPDHDGDGHPGITARYRSDDATYVGPYDDGSCMPNAPLPYRFRSASPYLRHWAAGYPGPGIRVDHLRLGFRARFAVAAGEPCADPMGAPGDGAFDMRAIECTVHPANLPDGSDRFFPADPRVLSMDYTCTPSEANFVDEQLPAFRVLGVGEVPGDARAPNGWLFVGRDIDRRVSEGTRVTSVVLGDDIDAGENSEPTCVHVRAAAYPSL